MPLTLTNTGDKLSPAKVRKFEKDLGAKLPDDFVQFLLATNGGRPPETIIRVPVANEEVLVDFLFGLDRKSDIPTWLKELSSDMPEGFIPIAKDPGGNIFIMSLNDASRGAVYYWDMQSSFTSSTDAGNTYPLAKSFSEFIALLDIS